MTVFDLNKGDFATVQKINLSGAAAGRLNSLGLAAGVKVQVLAFSMFKSAVLISFSSVRLGMRKRLAQKIEVVK